LLSEAERATIESLIQATITGKASESAAEVEAATESLAKGTEAFAAERMNAGIQRALTGKTVDAV
jgi:molecular chaperone HscA